MLTRKRTKLHGLNTSSGALSLPPDVWMCVVEQLISLDVHRLSLTCRSMRDLTHSQEVQTNWLLKWRPGRELLTATHAGMGLATVKALIASSSLYSEYKAQRSSTPAAWFPTLLGNVAHKGDAATAALLLDMGESLEQAGSRSCQNAEATEDARYRFLSAELSWVSYCVVSVVVSMIASLSWI